MRAFPLLTFLVFAGCSTLQSYTPLAGRVVDPEGRPVAAADVSVGGRVAGTTSVDGAFAVRRSSRENRVAVTVTSPGFATATKIFGARSGGNGNVIIVWPRSAAQRIRVADGGKLVFPRATLSIPANAFVDKAGRPIEGEADVSLTALDVTDSRQLASAPGDFTARMRDGSVRTLETFGLFELVATSGGREVRFAPGKAATVELERPRTDRDLPQVTPAFRFDPRNGLWEEVASEWQIGGTLTFADVSAVGWWNSDVPAETTCIKVRVLGCKPNDVGSVVAGATVIATGDDYWGAQGVNTTDSNGEVCLLVKRAAKVKIDVISGNLTANQLLVNTPAAVLDGSGCNCPLVTATHLCDAPLNNPATSLDATHFWASQNNSITSLNPDPPFDVVWLSSQVVPTSQSAVTVTMSPCVGAACFARPYQSGEYKSNCFYGYGTYTVTIAPPATPQPGLITGFFTYTDSGDSTVNEDLKPGHDEIDIELLDGSVHGCPGSITVHTNYYAKQPGGQSNHEQDFCVSNATHTYSFEWRAGYIKWYYDNQLLRHEQRPTTGEWPTQPGRIFLNLWGNSDANPWAGGMYTGSGATATFSNLTYVP